jgi:hypothetical protein
MMWQSQYLRRRFEKATPAVFVLMAGLVAFTAYGCVYAFRKPFTAASFEGLFIGGVHYKIAIVIAQVAGYALSKFIGIRIIATLQHAQRAGVLLGLIAVAAFSLLGFALSPPAWGIFWMFLNGLPLGMAWGVVFSYVEGRRVTEMLAALLCINFIVSSGFVKTVGKWLLVNAHISAFWMPFTAGMIFLPLLLVCVWLLEHLPPPSDSDQLARSPRSSMNREQRLSLFRRYWPGLILLVVVYLALTVVRDVRDNFAVEIWTELGHGNQPSILTTAEIPIALLVLAGVGLLALVKNNFKALWLYHGLLIGGAILLLVATVLFQRGLLSPVLWMILSGIGIIFPYILFNGLIFDRILAAFREKGNVGFLMYIADAIGYLGSVAVLLWRNFGEGEMSWVSFFIGLCYACGLLMAMATVLSWWYLKRKSAKA